jgi:5-methylcytosine-specific restriction endonuclease McrA
MPTRVSPPPTLTIHFSMNDILNKSTVLVLNRNWQAIHVKTPAEAFCMIASDAATALDISEGTFLPTKWSGWIALPVRECDPAVNTPRGPVRVPTVIIAVNYAKVPLRRPRFGPRGIWERDGGVCQYTGRKLAPKEGNIDHIVPRSRGGKTSWDNCVLAHREINNRKGDRLPHEAGLRLHKRPIAPRALPASAFIRNHYGVRDWQHFLG